MALVLSATLASHLSAQAASGLPADRSGLSPDNAGPQSGSISDDLTTEVGMSRMPKPRGGKSVVSADFLRHPVSEKVRRMLRRTLALMNAGDHEAAIAQLRETLAKYPDSAAYVHSFLGVEYVKTGRFKDAVNSFEQAASFFPHDAMTHYNFGLSLACAGDYGRAEQETRRALELDPKIETARTLLNVLLDREQTRN